MDVAEWNVEGTIEAGRREPHTLHVLVDALVVERMACAGAVPWRRRSSILLDDHRRRSGVWLCSRREGRSYAVSYYCFAATVAGLVVVLRRAPRLDGHRCRGNDHDSKESRDNAGVGSCGHERERERDGEGRERTVGG